jgi:uncharacterized protein (TIGR03067 family)
MKIVIPTFAIVLFTISFVIAGDEKELDKFQGKWTIVSLVEEGKAVPASEVDKLEITIEKDIYTAVEKGEVVAKYRVKVDTSKKPHTIDFTPLLGKEKEKANELAIYVFEKDQLKMCIDETGTMRPSVFEGKGTEKCSVVVLKKKDSK